MQFLFYLISGGIVASFIFLIGLGIEQGIKTPKNENEYVDSARWIDGK